MFGDISGGAAIFTAEREPLNEAQQHKQDRRRNPDRGIAGQHADEEGRGAHQAHGDQKGVLAPDEIADAPEDERTEWPYGKTRGKGRECENETGGFVDARKKLRRDDRREQAVEVEVIPFEHRAKRRGQDDLSFALPGIDRNCCSAFGHPSPLSYVPPFCRAFV